MNLNMNYQQVLAQMRQNPQAMSNQTIQSVFNCLDKKDHNGLVEIYKNTCQTMGQQPNPMFLR